METIAIYVYSLSIDILYSLICLFTCSRKYNFETELSLLRVYLTQEGDEQRIVLLGASQRRALFSGANF